MVTPNVAIVAIGECRSPPPQATTLPKTLTRIVHYSSQAGRARSPGIRGHEESFREFLGSVSMDDLNTTAGHVFEAARVPSEIRDEALL